MVGPRIMVRKATQDWLDRVQQDIHDTILNESTIIAHKIVVAELLKALDAAKVLLHAKAGPYQYASGGQRDAIDKAKVVWDEYWATPKLSDEERERIANEI